MSGPSKAERLRLLPPDLDDQLPGLREALDPTAVATRFERDWPRPGRAPSITACALSHLRWTPGISGEASYELTLGASAGPPAVTIGVVTVRPEAVTHRLFVDDDRLPGLVSAVDAAVAGAWLADRIGRPTNPSTVVPVRYRSGRRCVVRYEWPDGPSLYGKVLAGDRVDDLAATLSALGDQLVAPVVAGAPQWQLVVQADLGEPQPGSTQGPDRFGACGRLLGSLHSSAGPPAPSVTLADDADGLRQHLPMMQRMTESADVFAALVEDLVDLNDPGARTVPSHGAFRLDQVIVGRSGPRLVDLDSYSWAEPERDIGNLLAYLRWRAMRRPGTALAEATSSFLAGYRSTASGSVDDERVAAFEGASLLKIAARRYRRLSVDEWGLVPDLLDAARARVGAGSAR